MNDITHFLQQHVSILTDWEIIGGHKFARTTLNPEYVDHPLVKQFREDYNKMMEEYPLMEYSSYINLICELYRIEYFSRRLN